MCSACPAGEAGRGGPVATRAGKVQGKFAPHTPSGDSPTRVGTLSFGTKTHLALGTFDGGSGVRRYGILIEHAVQVSSQHV